MVKLYLDDLRPVPEGWELVKTAKEAINFLKNNDVEIVSLDHDLGPDEAVVGTGYDVLLWIEEQVVCNNYVPPTIYIHTANPSAEIKMRAAVSSIEKRRRNVG